MVIRVNPRTTFAVTYRVPSVSLPSLLSPFSLSLLPFPILSLRLSPFPSLSLLSLSPSLSYSLSPLLLFLSLHSLPTLSDSLVSDEFLGCDFPVLDF